MNILSCPSKEDRLRESSTGPQASGPFKEGKSRTGPNSVLRRPTRIPAALGMLFLVVAVSRDALGPATRLHDGLGRRLAADGRGRLGVGSEARRPLLRRQPGQVRRPAPGDRGRTGLQVVQPGGQRRDDALGLLPAPPVAGLGGKAEGDRGRLPRADAGRRPDARRSGSTPTWPPPATAWTWPGRPATRILRRPRCWARSCRRTSAGTRSAPAHGGARGASGVALAPCNRRSGRPGRIQDGAQPMPTSPVRPPVDPSRWSQSLAPASWTCDPVQRDLLREVPRPGRREGHPGLLADAPPGPRRSSPAGPSGPTRPMPVGPRGQAQYPKLVVLDARGSGYEIRSTSTRSTSTTGGEGPHRRPGRGPAPIGPRAGAPAPRWVYAAPLRRPVGRRPARNLASAGQQATY